jgi:hypothetical protein
MLSGVLDTVEQTAGFVRNAVSLPARQLGGILAALKAITSVLRGNDHKQPADHSPQDTDQFV